MIDKCPSGSEEVDLTFNDYREVFDITTEQGASDAANALLGSGSDLEVSSDDK